MIFANCHKYTYFVYISGFWNNNVQGFNLHFTLCKLYAVSTRFFEFENYITHMASSMQTNKTHCCMIITCTGLESKLQRTCFSERWVLGGGGSPKEPPHFTNNKSFVTEPVGREVLSPTFQICLVTWVEETNCRHHSFEFTVFTFTFHSQLEKNKTERFL